MEIVFCCFITINFFLIGLILPHMYWKIKMSEITRKLDEAIESVSVANNRIMSLDSMVETLIDTVNTLRTRVSELESQLDVSAELSKLEELRVQLNRLSSNLDLAETDN